MCGHLWGLHITATTAIYKRKINQKPIIEKLTKLYRVVTLIKSKGEECNRTVHNGLQDMKKGKTDLIGKESWVSPLRYGCCYTLKPCSFMLIIFRMFI